MYIFFIACLLFTSLVHASAQDPLGKKLVVAASTEVCRPFSKLCVSPKNNSQASPCSSKSTPAISVCSDSLSTSSSIYRDYPGQQNLPSTTALPSSESRFLVLSALHLYFDYPGQQRLS